MRLPEMTPQQKKKFFFLVVLPLVAAFVMSAGVVLSRMRIRSYTRIFGTVRHRAGEPAAYRVIMYRRTFNTPVSPIEAAALLQLPDGNKMLLYQGRSAPGDEALLVNFTVPKLPVGKYSLLWRISSDEYGRDELKVPFEIVERNEDAPRVYGERSGEVDTNIESVKITPLSADDDGVAVALHPVNARGLRSPFPDMLYLIAVTEDGSPLAVEAQLELIRGSIGLPRDSNCVGRLDKNCLNMFAEGARIPVTLRTDSLGLAPLVYVPRNDILFFRLLYRRVGEKDWKERRIELGSTHDDVSFVMPDRIFTGDLSLSLYAYTRKPLYVDVYQEGRWLYTTRVPVKREKASFTLWRKLFPKGMYKIQASIFYMPISNSIYGVTVMPARSSEGVSELEAAIREAERYAQVGRVYRNHLKWILRTRAIWHRQGFSVERVAPYFFGLLDSFHYEPDVRTSSRARRERSLMEIRSTGQAVVLSIMILSGIALVILVVGGTFLALRRRREARRRLQQLLEDETDFAGAAFSEAAENEERRLLLGFGLVMALLIGLMVWGLVWLMLHLKWEL